MKSGRNKVGQTGWGPGGDRVVDQADWTRSSPGCEDKWQVDGEEVGKRAKGQDAADSIKV